MDKAKALAQKYGFEKVTVDYQNVLRDREIDRSYILDAVEQSLGPEKPAEVTGYARRKVVAFLSSLRKGKHEPFALTGKGTNIRVEGKTLHGFAVMSEDQVVHMAAFREAGNA